MIAYTEILALGRLRLHSRFQVILFYFLTKKQ